MTDTDTAPLRAELERQAAAPEQENVRQLLDRMKPDRNGVVHIGNARGKIAVYLDETEAIELAHFYGPRDDAYRELMEAVEVAYPKEDE